MALVPSVSPTDAPGYIIGDDADAGDLFYPRILRIAEEVDAKVVAMEVGDMAQAERVAGMVVEGRKWDRCEIWRDHGLGREEVRSVRSVCGEGVVVKGEGNGRVVVVWR